MQYLLLIHVDPDDPVQNPVPGSAEFETLLQAYYDLDAETKAAGVLIESGALRPPADSTTVRVRDGARQLATGPVEATRTRLDGFYLIECPNLDEAIGWAAKIPHAATAAVEVRPLVVFAEPG